MKDLGTLDQELGTEKIGRLVFRYTTPAIIAMFIYAGWILVEGIIVGRGVGAEGLAAITLAMPILYLHRAAIYLIGVGGATLMSINLGRGDKQEAKEYLVQTMIYSWTLSIVMVVIYWIFLNPILLAFGATPGMLMTEAAKYSIIILIGFAPSVWGYSLYFNVRADGQPKMAMWVLSGGFILAAILDYITVFYLNMGISGTAWAVVFGETLPGVYFLWYFMKKSEIGLTWKDLFKIDMFKTWRITQVGFASFGVQMTGMIVIIVMNKMFMQYYGEGGISAYGVLMVYIMNYFVMIASGVGQGIQPVVSYNFGAKKFDRVKSSLFIGLKISLIIGVIGIVLLYLMPNQLMGLFITNNQEVAQIVLTGMKYYGITVPMLSITLVMSAYFQGLDKNISANLTSLGRSFIFLLPAVYILPKFMGSQGLWAATTLAETITVVIALILLLKEVKKLSSDWEAESRMEEERLKEHTTAL